MVHLLGARGSTLRLGQIAVGIQRVQVNAEYDRDCSCITSQLTILAVSWLWSQSNTGLAHAAM
jgi:hypothetical protein